MVLNKERRIFATLYQRAPNVLWAMTLLISLGLFLGFQELRSMALVSDTFASVDAKRDAAARVTRAILEYRQTQSDLIFNLVQPDVPRRGTDQWRESWNQLLEATRALSACLPPTEPRASQLSEERLALHARRFNATAERLEQGETQLLGESVLGIGFDERELQLLSLLADQLVDESQSECRRARNSLLRIKSTNLAVVLSMMVIPGALIVAGGFRLVRECRDSEARLRAAFNFSLHPMIVTDPRGKIESASQSVKTVFGWEPEEIVGQNVSVLMPVPFRGVHDSKVSAHLATGRETLIGKPRELEALRRDGTTFPCVVTLWKAPLPGIDSYLLMAIISDITEQKVNETKIAELNQQVTRAARQAGKAEIATNVLHNVGNVLNSLNVASSLIRESLQSDCYEDVQRVSQLIETHRDNLARFIAEDARGCHLPRFLAELFRQLRQQRETMDIELITLEKSIGHIKAIVESQQQYAKGIARVIEETDVSQVVADAVRISEASLADHGITVEVFSNPMPLVVVDQHKFLHVLVNLIGNARHACMESEASEKWIRIRVQHEDDRVWVKIQDNGVGIDPAAREHIFHHGFTTRKDGHGFGLHSVALAIEEFCGSIEVQSAGVGRGATFTISIPVSPAPRQSPEHALSAVAG